MSREDDFELYDHFESCNYIDPRNYERTIVKRGLRNADGSGVMAGLTNISNVHGYLINEGDRMPDEGSLTLRGYDIYDLVEGAIAEDRFGYEELVYLLLTGALPNKHELTCFQNLLDEWRDLPRGFVNDHLLTNPSRNVMNMLGRSILQLYASDPNPIDPSPKHEIDTAIALIARLPRVAVLAYYSIQQHYYRGDMVWHAAHEGLSTAETILDMLRPDHHYSHAEARMLDVMLMLQAEHGGGNNSTFTCRVLTSSGTDAYSAYSGAIGSLKGPKHGGANLKVREMLKDLEANVADWEDEGQVADYLARLLRKEAFDQAGLIYGMGHAVYTLSDPRAILCHRYASQLAAGSEWERELHLIENVERLSPQVMAQVKGSSKPLCANVDLYTGFVYDMLGIPEELYTPMFATARMAGWAAHRFEEIATGKRIIRPAYKNVLPHEKYVALSQRDAMSGFVPPAPGPAPAAEEDL